MNLTTKKINFNIDSNWFFFRSKPSDLPKKLDKDLLLKSAFNQLKANQSREANAITMIGDPRVSGHQNLHLEQIFPTIPIDFFFPGKMTSLLSQLETSADSVLLLYCGLESLAHKWEKPKIIDALESTNQAETLRFFEGFQSNGPIPSGPFIQQAIVSQEAKGRTHIWEPQVQTSPWDSTLGLSRNKKSKSISMLTSPLDRSVGLVGGTINFCDGGIENQVWPKTVSYLSFRDPLNGISLESPREIARICAEILAPHLEHLENPDPQGISITISSVFPALISGVGQALKDNLPAHLAIYFSPDELYVGSCPFCGLLKLLATPKDRGAEVFIDLHSFPEISCFFFYLES